MAGTDNRNPWDDYKKLRKEIEQYDAALLERPFVVLANKMDDPAAAENLPLFKRKTRTKPIPMSTVDGTGIAQFTQWLWETLRPPPQGAFIAAAADAPPSPTPTADDDIIPAEALAHAPFLDITKKPKKNKKP